MNVLLILAGVFVVYELLTQQQRISALSAPIGTGGISAQRANLEVQQSSMLGSEVGSGISLGTQAATDIANSAGSSFSQAIPIIGGVVSTVAGILLGQHTARLKGAIAENQLIPQCTQAFDADISELIAGWNGGQVTAKEFQAAAAQMDANLYKFMKGNATGPGRSWSGSQKSMNDGSGAACTKSCTTECCAYYNDYHPALVILSQLAGGATLNDPRVQPTSGGWLVTIPEVYPPPAQYGNYTRPAYTVTMQSPQAAGSMISL